MARQGDKFKPFLYAFDLPATGTGLFHGSLHLDTDADFIIVATMFRSTEAITNVPMTDVRLVTQGGRRFANAMVPIAQLFGDGQRPFIWPVARRVLAGSYFQVTVNKRVAENITSFQFGFDGFKVEETEAALKEYQ